MKRLFKSLAALVLVVSMVGCSKESSEEQLESTTQLELKLKGNIATLKPTTRVDANGFVDNDKVGVYVSSTGELNASNNMLDNEALAYSSGNLIIPAGKEVYWGSQNVRLSVWAYYPYKSNIKGNTAYLFEVNADQSTETNFYSSDFITAQAINLAPQPESVNLEFNHSLSKIAVTLSKGGNATDDEWESLEKNLLICGAVVDGTIDLATGIAITGTSKANVKSLADGGTYSAIVYPQKGEIAFRLEMGDDIYLYTTTVDYKAGYQYDYEFTVDMYNPQQLSLDAVSITPWNKEGESEKGNMSDIITFTDSKFKEYLLQEELYKEVNISVEGGSCTPSSANGRIDANNDGEISYSEAKSVKYIKVWKMGINDMSELKYFPNLVSLDCAANELSTLDVSNNHLLEYLNCENNKFTSLDVSNNTALIWLSCEDNRLTTLDVSNNINLERFECFRTDITSLDVSNNTALKRLDCGDVKITTLDVTQNALLEHLQFGGVKLGSIDLSKNSKLKYLYCGDSNLSALNVSGNLELITIDCRNNQIASLDVSDNLVLKTLICESNSISTLDISKNTELRILDCGTNKLSTLSVSDQIGLESLACGHNNLETVDVSANLELEYFDCIDNQIELIDVSKNPKLKHFDCRKNQITSLDVSKNSALKTLICTPMNDVDGNNLLETIYIAEGQDIATLEKPEATQIVEKE